MKLVHQINLAFGIALVLVLSVTAIVIHFVLLDHLIGAQREDLKAMGAEMTASLKREYIHMGGITAKELSPAMPAPPSNSGISAILTDNTGSIITVSPSSYEVRKIEPLAIAVTNPEAASVR
ncbi:MAG: sensor histidine kinase, partial [Paenibacillus sp.]|nr:sensor histidine kinase [Paenibacillus sp.]